MMRTSRLPARSLPTALLTSLLPVSLAILLAACSGVEIEPGPVDAFAAADYRYYKWRTDPLPRNTRTTDPVYRLDPLMRKHVDNNLRAKGYILDPERAQFSVDYLYAPGLRDGASPEQASNISHLPRVTPNRQVDGASVDNAIALGGVKETANIRLQFNDLASRSALWEARMTKIVEDANRADRGTLDSNLKEHINRAMRDLPAAGS